MVLIPLYGLLRLFHVKQDRRSKTGRKISGEGLGHDSGRKRGRQHGKKVKRGH
jgi:hypothetical protein